MERLEKRNGSIDLLKFLCMLGIVMIHVINQGGIIYSISNRFSFYGVSYLYILVCSSVDIFAIVSGYLYIKKDKTKYKNIFGLIVSMIFYSLLITILFYSINLYNIREEGIERFIYSLFPPIADKYWYITCYILLFCMIPYINKLLRSYSQHEFRIFVFILFILLSIISTLGFHDYFRINAGYSPFWLLFCYIIGAYFGTYHIELKNIKMKLFGLLLVTSIIFFVIYNYISKGISGYIIAYNSPFILTISILIFLIFSNKKVSSNKLINYLSKTSFGVYLIHGNILIYDYILKDKFMFLCNKNILLIICGIVVISLIIYLICSIIEYIRIYIFKILKINILIEYFGNKVDLFLKEK